MIRLGRRFWAGEINSFYSVAGLSWVLLVVVVFVITLFLSMVSTLQNNLVAVDIVRLTFVTPRHQPAIMGSVSELRVSGTMQVWQAAAEAQSGDPAMSVMMLSRMLADDQVSSGREYATNLLLLANSLSPFVDYSTLRIAGLERVGDWRQLHGMANDAIQAGRLDDAQLAFEAFMRVNPDLATIHYANFLQRWRGDLAGAIGILQTMLKEHPNSDNAIAWLVRLGKFQELDKAPIAAESTYQAVLQRDPNNIDAYVGLGNVAYETGSLENAPRFFDQAIKLDPENPAPYYATAVMLADEKRYQDADAWFVKAIEREVGDKRWLYRDRGLTAQKAGNNQLALDVFSQAVAMYPDFAPAYFELAGLHLANGSLDDAHSAIDQAIQLSTVPNAGYFYRAGEIAERDGDHGAALDFYNQALQANPSFQSARNAVDRLSQ